MATNRPRSSRSSSSSSSKAGSSSSGRKPAPKRKPAAKPVKRDADLDESLTDFDFEETRQQHDAGDDFGADIIDDAPPAKAAPRGRKPSSRSEPVREEAPRQPAPPPSRRERQPEPQDDFGFEPDAGPVKFTDGFAAREDRSPRDDRSQRADRSKRDDDDDDRDERSEGDATATGDSDSEEGQSGSTDSGEGGQHRRRRRRRRKKGRGGNSEFNENSNSNSGSNQGHQQGMVRQQGQYRPRPQYGGNQRNDRFRHQGGGDRPDFKKSRGPTSKFQRNAPPPEPAVTSGVIEGVLELHPKGYGFLRDVTNDYAARETDPFVSSSFVERHHLREGILIKGEVGPGSRGQGPRLLNIESIDNKPPEQFEQLKHFDTLTPINPHEQLKLEIPGGPVTMRVMDLLTPIGKGQRALIVAPPRTGKTILLQQIAESISTNHPEVHLIVLLIDERPEEVTDMRRNVRGEVIASSMDREIESHVRISQLIFERGKRLAEEGKDVVILMDSVTRTARAFNKWISQSGRARGVMTGGLDVKALDIPKKMFGTARRFEDGGSLTVIATALIDTNSKMDEVIFQEFKGTGNMELVLSRDLADRRIWPALDITKSGTRREEKILSPEVLDGVIMLRRSLVSMNPTEAMDQLIRTLGKFPTNAEFLARIRNVL
jgi:transcription termination factor Rho